MRGGLEQAVSALSTRSFSLLEPSGGSFDVVDYEPLFEPAPQDSALYGDLVRPRPLGKKRAEKIVARYHEMMTATLYGATHLRFRISDSKGSIGYPDIVDFEGRRARETKGIGEKTTLDFRDHQVYYLGDFQCRFPEFVVSYHAFRYASPDKPLAQMTPSELLAFLVRGPVFSLSLPLSLVHRLYTMPAGDKDHRRASQVHRFWGSPKWEPRTRVQGSVVNRLTHDHSSVISSLGLAPEAYVISYSRPARPLLCHGVPIASFPIVTIRDKNHSEWVAQFRKEYPDNLVYPHVSSRSLTVDSSDPLYNPSFAGISDLKSEGCSDVLDFNSSSSGLSEDDSIPF